MNFVWKKMDRLHRKMTILVSKTNFYKLKVVEKLPFHGHYWQYDRPPPPSLPHTHTQTPTAPTTTSPPLPTESLNPVEKSQQRAVYAPGGRPYEFLYSEHS